MYAPSSVNCVEEALQGIYLDLCHADLKMKALIKKTFTWEQTDLHQYRGIKTA
jgi:hypothetical protein